MKIAITVGHSRLANGIYTSADGTKYGGGNEYLFNKKLAPYIKKYLEKNGHKVDVIRCPEKVFLNHTEERNYKLSRVNTGSYNLVMELHLNAAAPTAEGCEVLYVSSKGKYYANKIEKKLATVFKGKGANARGNLYMLNKTIPVCIMLETFFCTNKKEWKYANKNIGKIAKLIAAGIGK